MKKNISRKILSVLIIPFLVLSFTGAREEKTIEAMGFHFGSSITGPKNETYVLPSGDTLVPADGEIIVLKDIDSIEVISPVMDMFLLRDYDYNGVSGWDKYEFGMRRHRPADKKIILEFKKLDDFKKEQFIYASLAAVGSKKNYFELMKYVGRRLDAVLAPQLVQMPPGVKELYVNRIGKPRLRPMLSYLGYSFAGDNESTADVLSAVSETTNLHLYAFNYLLDNKQQQVSANRLPLLLNAGQMFSDLTLKLLCSSQIEPGCTVQIINRLSQEITRTCRGQLLDSDVSDDFLLAERDYIGKYITRCSLLSGPMYGFSIWSGMKAGGCDDQLCDVGYSIGYNIGVALQIVNDVSDFSTLKSDHYSDFANNKPTLAVYCLKKQGITGKENLTAAIMSSGAFTKSIDLAASYSAAADCLINKLPASDESRALKRVLLITTDNKFIREIKNS